MVSSHTNDQDFYMNRRTLDDVLHLDTVEVGGSSPPTPTRGNASGDLSLIRQKSADRLLTDYEGGVQSANVTEKGYKADCDHEYGPERRFRGQPGTAMDGYWMTRGCLHCNSFTLRAEGGDSMALLVARLQDLGCDPHPAE